MRSRRWNQSWVGRDHARWHLAAAQAFSAEVDGTDVIVKEAFFRLTGAALDAFLTEYARSFGAQAAAYARQARVRWRSGEVTMSASVMRRLYEIIPSYMSPEERLNIVETLWRRYSGSSVKYVYVGPDAATDDVMTAAYSHFDALLSFGNLPLGLSTRFNWLTANDAIAARRLLSEFAAREKDGSFLLARTKVAAMLAGLRERTARDIDALSHTVEVGKHRLVIKADPLRAGVLVSDSPFAQIKPKPPVPFPFVGLAVAAIVITFVIVGVTNGPSHSSGGISSDTAAVATVARVMAPRPAAAAAAVVNPEHPPAERAAAAVGPAQRDLR